MLDSNRIKRISLSRLVTSVFRKVTMTTRQQVAIELESPLWDGWAHGGDCKADDHLQISYFQWGNPLVPNKALF